MLAFSQLSVIREFGLLLALSVVLSFLAARFVVLVAPPAPPAGGRPGERTADGSPLVGVM